MVSNIPIRLVHNNGDLTQIMATDVALDVERKVGGFALPYTGSTRMGFELNLNNASIIINGIITDDSITSASASSSNAGATAYVDFSVNHGRANEGFSGLDSWIPTNADAATIVGTATHETVEDAKNGITITATDGTSYDIWFVGYAGSVANQRGLDAGSGRYYIAIYNTSASTKGSHTDIADNLFDVIQNESALNSRFTASLKTSALTGEANTQVEITQDVLGTAGNSDTPIYTASNTNVGVRKLPYVRVFTGGKATSTGLSSGDKVMNLYGVLNNSDNKTIRSRLTDILPGVDEQQRKFADYIIGIQIPYDSIFHASGAEKYSARNFFMPTGAFRTPEEKRTDSSEPAETTFEPDTPSGDFTGIKGTVQKATFTRLGGEPIWSFTIIFTPIDWIW